MALQKHSLLFDDSPSPRFLARDSVGDKHWFFLKYLYTDEQGQVCKLEGQYSEGHPYEIFNLSQVLNFSEIINEVRNREELLGRETDYYDPRFAAGHKPGCPMAMPEFRDESPEIREKI